MGWVNEILSFGVSVGNSETGHGSLFVRELARILRCLNAYVKDEVKREVHVGRRHEDTDDFVIGADTRRLELAAVFTRVRDRFINAVNEDAQRRNAEKFAQAMGQTLDIPKELPLMDFVDIVGERFKLTERENELLREEVVDEMIQARVQKPTAFTIAQGFTAAAKRLGDGQMDRRQEIEAIGWQIIEDPTNTLIKAAQDALKGARRN
jgi:hypothetical protein